MSFAGHLLPADVRSAVSYRSLRSFSELASLPRDKAVRVGLVALFSATGSFLFGLDIGYIAPIVASSPFKRDIFGDPDKEIPESINGMIVSLFSVGAMIASFPVITSFFLDTFGRKPSIMLGAAVFIIGSIIQASSFDLVQLLIGRCVSGMSIGILSSVIVLYQGELAPASMRGGMTTLYQLMITFGILVAAFIDELFVERDNGWRLVICMMCVPAMILLIGMIFMPRSPRWLVQRGRLEEARNVLLTVRDRGQAEKEVAEIAEEVKQGEEMGLPRWTELFSGRVGRLVFLGVSLQLLQQLVGMNAFMYFGPTIFQSLHFRQEHVHDDQQLRELCLNLPSYRPCRPCWPQSPDDLQCGGNGLVMCIHGCCWPDVCASM